MSKNQNDNPKNLWDRIKDTETFQNIKNNTDQIKENFQSNVKKQEEKRNRQAWQKPNENISAPSKVQSKAKSLDSHPIASQDSQTLPSRVRDRQDSRSQALGQRSQSAKKKVKESDGFSFLFAFDSIYIVIKNAIIICIIFLLFLVCLGGGVAYGYFNSLLSDEFQLNEEELAAEVANVSSSSSMYYRDGTLIDDLRSDLQRTPISLEEISPTLIAAVIATEDNYFFEHEGVVPKAIFRAVFEQVTGAGNTGGSTITQQLVKQQLLSHETTFERKANEIVLAMELEESTSKNNILEAYLNVSPFGRNNRGENIAGIEEAARGIFGVAAKDLNLAQAAYLAGLPKSPIEYSPYAQNGQFKEDMSAGLERQDDVLFFMLREGYITEEEFNQASAYDITQDFLDPVPDVESKLSYVYDEVERRGRDIIMEILVEASDYTMEDLDQDQNLYDDFYNQADDQLRNGGYKITTTIDQGIQDRLQEVIQENAWFIGSPRNVYWENEETGETEHMVEEAQNGSILIDNATGQIIAFVGGLDYDKNNFNNATQMRRSPASALKPLSVYGPGLELGVITPASVVYDGPVRINIPGVPEAYEPKNATGFSNRWWNVREALASSQNIPAIRIFSEIYTNYDIKPYFRKAGIGSDAIPDEDFNYLSLALGGTTVGTTVEELTGAYTAIANDGVFQETHIISKIEDDQGDVIYNAEEEFEEQRVFSEETAFLLQDILRDTSRSGTARASRGALNFDLDLMSKTGTSDDTKDIWYIGSTPKVTFGSWIGYRNIMTTNKLQPEFGYSSSNRNQIIWARMMNAIHEINPDLLGIDQTFDQPASIVEESVLASTGMKPGQVTGPNGRTYVASGSYKTEYFHPDHVPGITTYDFAINATDKELQRFWSGGESGNNNSQSYFNRFFNSNDQQGQDQNESQDSTEQESQDQQQEQSGNAVSDFIDGIVDQFTQ